MPPTDSLSAANDALKAGLASLAKGDLDAAQASFEQSLTHVPENHIALQNLAAIAVKRGALEEAEAYLLRISGSNVTSEVLLDLGKIQAALGKTKDALTTLKGALTVAEAEPNANASDASVIQKHLAAIYQAVGDVAEAKTLYRALIDSNPIDKGAVFAYAKLMWPDEPASVIKLLEDLLLAVIDPSDRRDVLLELILYKEIETRRTLGLAPYHIDDLSHISVRHCTEELEGLLRVCRDLLDTDPQDHVSRLAYAKALHARGDVSASQEQYHTLAVWSPGEMASAVHFDDDFTAKAAAVNLQSVLAELPGVQYAYEQDFGDNPVIVISCDARYFVQFTKPLILSLECQIPGCCVHVHIMDASADLLQEAIEWCSALDTVRCAFSIEDTGLSANDPNDAASYYHAIRFVRFVQLRERYSGPLWMIDADALANGNAERLLNSAADWDVVLRVRPGRLEPWNVVSAGLVGMGNTSEALDFFTYVATYVAQVWRQGRLPWGVDQMALYSALLRYEPKRLKLLGPSELDVDVHPDGLFWFLSGRNKALFAYITNEQDRVMALLNERERRYAQIYLKYLS
jgi:tetratricopeptide (TPR) repeat protein